MASHARRRFQPSAMVSRSRTASPEVRTVSVSRDVRGSVPRRRGPRLHAWRASRSALAMPSRSFRRVRLFRRCAQVSHHAFSPQPTGNAWSSPHRAHQARTCRRLPQPSRLLAKGSVRLPALCSCHTSRVRSFSRWARRAFSRCLKERSSRQLRRSWSRWAHSAARNPKCAGSLGVTVVSPSTSPHAEPDGSAADRQAYAGRGSSAGSRLAPCGARVLASRGGVAQPHEGAAGAAGRVTPTRSAVRRATGAERPLWGSAPAPESGAPVAPRRPRREGPRSSCRAPPRAG